MFKLDFSKEEVCIVRYSDNACKYVRVESSDQLGEEIDQFTKGGDYELQYMNGELSHDATNDPLTLYIIAEEQNAPLWLVSALYNNYGNTVDVENVLKYDYLQIYWARDKEDAFEEYVDSIGILEEIPEYLRYYFDYEKYERDLKLGGDITIIDGLYYDNKGNEAYIIVQGY